MNDKSYLDEYVFETNVKLQKGERELDSSNDIEKEDLEETIDLKYIEEQFGQKSDGDQDGR